MSIVNHAQLVSLKQARLNWWFQLTSPPPRTNSEHKRRWTFKNLPTRITIVDFQQLDFEINIRYVQLYKVNEINKRFSMSVITDADRRWVLFAGSAGEVEFWLSLAAWTVTTEEEEEGSTKAGGSS